MWTVKAHGRPFPRFREAPRSMQLGLSSAPRGAVGMWRPHSTTGCAPPACGGLRSTRGYNPRSLRDRIHLSKTGALGRRCNSAGI